MNEIEKIIKIICNKIQEQLTLDNSNSELVIEMINSLTGLVAANKQNIIINNYNDVSDK